MSFAAQLAGDGRSMAGTVDFNGCSDINLTRFNTPILTGQWTGTYTCGQGLTNVEIDIHDDLNAIFRFFVEDSALGALDGFFHGTFQRGGLDVRFQPIGSTIVGFFVEPSNTDFFTIGFTAELDGSGRTMSGTIDDPSCTTIELKKSNLPALGNISSVGLAGADSPTIVCTIIGKSNLDLIVLAEAFNNVVDPVLYMAPVTVPVSEVRQSPLAISNDDFGTAVLPIIGRPLGQPKDAALVINNIEPGAYCVYAFMTSGTRGEVSLQINNGDLFR